MTAHRGLWLSDSLADRRYTVSLCAGCAVLVGCDQDASWARGRGGPLTQSLEALVYSFDSHPGIVAMARRVIRATLESTEKQLS
jgi:hypothetical protein